MNHSTRLLAYGFIIILMMMISLAVISFHYSSISSGSVNLAITRQMEKISLINELSTIVRNHSNFTQSKLLSSDALSHSEIASDFNRIADAYIDFRRQLLHLLDPTEKEILLTIDRFEQEIVGLNKQVSILLLDSNGDQESNILLQQVLAETASLLAYLSKLNQSQLLEAQRALLTASSDAEESQTQFTLYVVYSILVSFAVAILAVWYSQRMSTQLQGINSYLEEKLEERTETLLDTQKLLEDNTELTRLALTDNLTGLSNRTHMNKILEKEFSRYLRHNQRFGIIMVDIDYFKNINDSYGHDLGDQVLIQLSRSFEQAIRTTDYISRWGGEEFLICCTTINEDDLLPIAENIQKMIFNSVFDTVESVTISLGCALIQPDEKINELIKRADVALYAAKYNGRNQAVVSEFVDFM